jgi:hypothetical protein
MTNARNQLRSSGGSIRSGSAFALGNSGRKKELELEENTASLEINKSSLPNTRSHFAGGGANARGDALSLAPAVRSRSAAVVSRVEMPPSGHFEPHARRNQKSLGYVLPMVVIVVVAAIWFGIMLQMKNKAVESMQIVTITSSTGELKLVASLDGQVLNKGKPLSMPLQLNLTTGKHTVELRRPGLIAESIEFNVGGIGSPSSHHVVFKRDPAVPTAQLRILSEPPGAQISQADGWDSGLTPHVFKYVPVGVAQRFRVTHPNCRAGSFEEMIPSSEAGRTRHRKLELRDCKGRP